MNPPPPASVSPTANHDSAICRWEGQISNGIGTTNSIPMASLSADANELVLSGTLGTFRLSRESIVRLGRGRMYPWLFGGIRIHHNSPEQPEELQFKPFAVSSREVLSQLRKLGYPAG